jgi:PPOX class probable F420-dependent enzyme
MEEFSNLKYINLQTFRKNGEPVNTPVWFVILNDKIYVLTKEFTGKVKRLKNNSNVKIAPCTLRGKLKGKWISGKADFASESEIDNIMQLRNKKYGFWSKMVGAFTTKKGKYVGFSIKLD